jgi:uncharacterized protein (DUF1697 family)
MPTHVALLRGINVGGANKVAMADLRELMESLGHGDVASYIQSGNVVFTPGAGGGTTDLAEALEAAMERSLGIRPRVIVVTRDELAAVVSGNPYPGEPEPRFVHAVFFRGGPEPAVAQHAAAVQQQVRAKGSRDEASVVGQVLYVHTPGGFGRSELAALLLGKPRSPAALGTARNWATVTKLLAMCGE